MQQADDSDILKQGYQTKYIKKEPWWEEFLKTQTVMETQDDFTDLSQFLKGPSVLPRG